ncbi:MAG: hypothetical protein HQM12_18270 [SAR324 cluster bacterium]|nr:hypothetical protein [SAR324 cluster bacterium]
MNKKSYIQAKKYVNFRSGKLFKKQRNHKRRAFAKTAKTAFELNKFDTHTSAWDIT